MSKKSTRGYWGEVRDLINQASKSRPLTVDSPAGDERADEDWDNEMDEILEQAIRMVQHRKNSVPPDLAWLVKETQ